MTKYLPGFPPPQDLGALLPAPERAGMFGSRLRRRQNALVPNITPPALPYPFSLPATALDADAIADLTPSSSYTPPLSTNAWGRAAGARAVQAGPEVEFTPGNLIVPSPSAVPHYRKPPPEIVALAQASQRATGIPASVNIAQWIHEGAWGEHTPQNSNNFFGYKEYDRKRPSVLAWTKEYDSKGQPHRKREPFRVFQSPEEGWAAHTRLLTNDPRYAKAMALTHDPDAFIDAIAGTYAPNNPNYAKLIKETMRKNHLYQYNTLPPAPNK